jgi:hypothetical protein
LQNGIPSSSQYTESLLASAEVPEIVFSHDAKDEEESRASRRPLQRSVFPLPTPPRSLADELEEKNSAAKHVNGLQNGNGTANAGGTGNGPSAAVAVARNENQFRDFDESMESVGGVSSEAEGEWFAEDDGFLEEMLGVDPLMRTEVEMLQKEKETWESDQNQLEKEKKKLREQKEDFER